MATGAHDFVRPPPPSTPHSSSIRFPRGLAGRSVETRAGSTCDACDGAAELFKPGPHAGADGEEAGDGENCAGVPAVGAGGNRYNVQRNAAASAVGAGWESVHIQRSLRWMSRSDGNWGPRFCSTAPAQEQHTELLWTGPSPASQIPARRIDQVLYDMIGSAKRGILLVTFAANKISRLTDGLVLWAQIIFQLRRRGKGERESGAFLLGRQDSISGRVTTYVCYDDLDPDAYQSGAIAFHAVGNAALWEYCRKKKLQVLADVHTHPSQNVRQSPIDQRHPMIPMQGHTAMIVPNFAKTPWWSLGAVGVYEYLGDFKWRTHDASQKPPRVSLAPW